MLLKRFIHCSFAKKTLIPTQSRKPPHPSGTTFHPGFFVLFCFFELAGSIKRIEFCNSNLCSFMVSGNAACDKNEPMHKNGIFSCFCQLSGQDMGRTARRICCKCQLITVSVFTLTAAKSTPLVSLILHIEASRIPVFLSISLAAL